LARNLYLRYKQNFPEKERQAFDSLLQYCLDPDGIFDDLLPLIDAEKDPQNSPFAQSSKDALRGRVVISNTLSNAWLGLAPACVQAADRPSPESHDCIFILRGAKVPFVLRPTTPGTTEGAIGMHHLVGEFYGGMGLMAGIMDSTVMPDREYVIV
jgi:hypothetical protein